MRTHATAYSNHKLAAVVLALLLAITVAANAQSTRAAAGLGGTWRVQVTQVNCDTGAALFPPFQSMLTFNEDGTMIGTTLNPSFAAGQRSSDFGVWSFQGNQTYSAASEAYILFTAGPFQRGIQRLDQTITMNGDSWSSIATIKFYDANHVQYIAGCALATASRFQ
jgi:hypothetical protein